MRSRDGLNATPDVTPNRGNTRTPDRPRAVEGRVKWYRVGGPDVSAGPGHAARYRRGTALLCIGFLHRTATIRCRAPGNRR